MKKSFLIYTLFLSFIIMINTVYAENDIEKNSENPELTCIYSKGTTQFPIMYTQDSKGNIKVWQINKNKYADEAKKPTKTSPHWELIYDETNDSFNPKTTLTLVHATDAIHQFRIDDSYKTRFKTCPPCVDHRKNGNTTKYETLFYSQKKSGKCSSGSTHSIYTSTSATTIEEVNSNKILQSSELSDDEKGKMYNCQYGDINFYISDDEQKVYTDIPETDKYNQYKNTIKFSRDEFLNDSKENKNNKEKCPRTLYRMCGESDPYINPDGIPCDWYVTFHGPIEGYTTKAILKTSETGKDKEDNKENIKSCEDLFSPSTIKEIDKIMGLVRIAVPIILIVFGIVDFFRATFSDNEDNMKKDRERFIKRIIAAIIVFIVPMFVHLVLTIANNVWGYINPETCVK